VTARQEIVEVYESVFGAVLGRVKD